MATIEQNRVDAERVAARLAEALTAFQQSASDRDRDSAILRFQLAYEVT